MQDSLAGTENSVYDALGRLVSRGYTTGGVQLIHIEQTFDVRNLLTNQTRYSQGSPALQVATTDYTYNAANQVTNLHHQNSTPTRASAH